MMAGFRFSSVLFRSALMGTLVLSPIAAEANDIGGAIVGGIIGGIIGGALVKGGNGGGGGGHRIHSAPPEASEKTRQIQQALFALGFYHGLIDGRTGKETREAIGDYQRKINETPTGDLTDSQLKVLFAAYAQKTNPTPSPTQPEPAQHGNFGLLIEAILHVTPGLSAPGSGSTNAPTPDFASATVPGDRSISANPGPVHHYNTVCLGTSALNAANDSGLVRKIKDHVCASLALVAVETQKRLADPKFADASALSDQCKATAEAINRELKPGDTPHAMIARLRDELSGLSSDQRAGAIESYAVCAGLSLGSNNLDNMRSIAIALAAMNETTFLEFVASQAALGIEEKADGTKAATWFEEAADVPMTPVQLASADPARQSQLDYFRGTAAQLRNTPQQAQTVSTLVPNFFANQKSAGVDPQPVSNAPDPGTVGKGLSHTQVLDYIRPSIVIVYQPEGTGTGYFISPTLILTNTHVVEDAGNLVVVANKTLGVRVAKVMAKGMTHDGVGVDAAVLEIIGSPSPSFLRLNQQLKEGQAITIGGYPGLAQKNRDAAYDSFIKLLDGQRVPTIDAIPAPKFDFGFVQALITNPTDNMHNIQEGLNTASGNSGSPIVDSCGSAVGLHYQGTRTLFNVVNDPSGGSVAVGESSKFNFALRIDEIIKFLKSANARYYEVVTPCAD